MRDLRVHLAHDWLVGLRGGELVLDRLARLYGPTTLYTLVNDGRGVTGAIDSCRVVTSPLQRFPGATGRMRRWYLALMPWAVGRLRVVGPDRPDGCDLLISTSSAVMKSIRPPAGVPHLCYCHSPARYIWAQTDDYAVGAGGSLRALGLRAVRRRFQSWDRSTADRVTKFIANGRHTAERIRRAYGREAEIVYPPVRTSEFTPDESVSREEWFLLVSALEPYKRADLAIRAAARRGWSLKVVGGGTQARALHRLAAESGGGVEMLGRVDDETLRSLYRRARALIYPQLEDFGIIAVEAQACGCPVIAFAGGGALETVTEETGVFFGEQTVGALIDAVARFESRVGGFPDCRANAERFAESRFDEAMRAQVDALMGAGATAS